MKKMVDFLIGLGYNKIMKKRPDKSKFKRINFVWGGVFNLGLFSCPVWSPNAPPFRRPDENTKGF